MQNFVNQNKIKLLIKLRSKYMLRKIEQSKISIQFELKLANLELFSISKKTIKKSKKSVFFNNDQITTTLESENEFELLEQIFDSNEQNYQEWNSLITTNQNLNHEDSNLNLLYKQIAQIEELIHQTKQELKEQFN
eukprot:TRINITY_DN13517_c0_g1_i2.p2 TRINITY_DN13517_c0_g1~~TRINITY_DN13517_c0_g1_i2.p2  ORF type:complete len:136 (+),score=23.25 TRINITY_DN13517_c0_g1_i2:107-514(+)